MILNLLMTLHAEHAPTSPIQQPFANHSTEFIIFIYMVEGQASFHLTYTG